MVVLLLSTHFGEFEWSPVCFFAESAPRPVQSISRYFCLSSIVSCVSPRMGPGTAWIEDFGSKSALKKLQTKKPLFTESGPRRLSIVCLSPSLTFFYRSFSVPPTPFLPGLICPFYPFLAVFVRFCLFLLFLSVSVSFFPLWTFLVYVLLSTHVERYSVSQIWDFLKMFLANSGKARGCFTNKQPCDSLIQSAFSSHSFTAPPRPNG